MNLGELWGWEKRKLGCRIRSESGNPALDEMRDRLAKLTGVDVPDLMAKTAEETDEMISQSMSKSQRPKGLSKPAKTLQRANSDRSLAMQPGTADANAGRTASRNLQGASSTVSLLAFQKESMQSTEVTKTRKNIHKKFFSVPRSPPTKIMLDLQKDRLLFNTGPVQKDYDLPDSVDQLPPVDSRTVVQKQRPSSTASNPRHSAPRVKPHSGRSAFEASDVSIETDNNPFKAIYKGDLFSTRGEYETGIIYQSRQMTFDDMDQWEDDRVKRRARGKVVSSSTSLLGGAAAADGDSDVLAAAATSPPPTAGLSQSEAQRRSEHEAKLHCAHSIAKWSERAENAQRLADEGAVPATIALSKDDSADVRRACAAALRNMAQHAILCAQLVKHSAVPVISELGAAARDSGVARDCGLALVNLTVVNGIEGKLVEDGIVIALVSLMNQHEELSELCSRGLFNLTCVEKQYMYMERVVKAFVSLSTSTVAAVKHVCAAALCNICDIKLMRPRTVEEGVVQVLGTLARGAEARTRRVCAIVLHSLASTKACRTDMVAKGAVQVLYSLSSDVDTITLHYIASATIRLTMEKANLPRLVHEGGVTALCNICLRCPRDVATTQLCASALALLSQHGAGRRAIVAEGCVPALVTLLREACDLSTLRQGLSALTHLLVDESHHEQVLAQGGVDAVVVLSGHAAAEIREACALSLFNFSRGDAVKERTVSAAAIPAIIALSRGHVLNGLATPASSECRMRCAAALCKLAAVEANVSLMVDAGVVAAFIDMLQTRDADIVKHCCAALCRLARDDASAALIADGAVSHVIAGIQSPQSDAATRRACCAVLSAVSAHEPCRRLLCEMGALAALVTLASDKQADDSTRLRCAVAFANLSHEPTVRSEMVAMGIVPVVAELSNSYSEENQLYCARAICNLGCHAGSEEAIVSQGAVAALMMICMVRAVSHFTKKVCAKALLNLLCTNTSVLENFLPKLAKDGLVQAVSVLSRLNEEDVMRVCADIFCTLSAIPLGRSLLVEHRATTIDIYNLMRSTDHTTQVVCGKTACNLLSFADSQERAVHAGGVKVLKQLCEHGDPEAELYAAEAFFLIAGDAAFRVELLKHDVLPALITNARSRPGSAVCVACLKVLAHLASDKACRKALIEAAAVPVLCALIDETVEVDQDVQAVYSLSLHVLTHCALCQGATWRGALSTTCIVQALKTLYTKLGDSGNDSENAAKTRGFVAGALRSLAEEDDECKRLVCTSDAINLLVDIAAKHDAQDADVLVACAATFYRVSKAQESNDLLVRHGVLEALPVVGTADDVICKALVAATLHSLALSPKHREALVAHASVLDLMLTIADSSADAADKALVVVPVARRQTGYAPPVPKPKHSLQALDDAAVATVRSIAQTFYWLSRCADASNRQSLQTRGLVPLLIRLAKHSDDVVGGACAEALKALASGGAGGIEEGTVSALIAMTLSSGQAANGNAHFDEVEVVGLPALDSVRFAPEADLLPSNSLSSFTAHTVAVQKMAGGHAGAGPPPPEPPEMDSDVQDTGFTFAENDGGNDDDDHCGAAMMFAKIQADAA
ncbi:armadillo-type protein [Pelagophyceae sp. CCMP2097]|nr:armadillo-type protein [Pelagophyceae sp. CCMP2097]